MADLFVPEGSKDKVIVEAFPGPGQLTRSLLALPKERIKKLIILEQEPKYLDYLLPLAELDPRVKIIPVTALEWDAFARIEQQGLLDDVEVIDWDQGVHPTLQFISHLPITVYGEQLIAQLLRLVPSRSWLHKFGRIKMNYLLSQYVWERLNAPPSHTTMRCKLSVMASATASLKPLMDEELRPFAKHFHPTPPKNSTKVTNRQVGNPFLAIEIIPLEERIIDETKLEMWDYCCRRLFVRKATPLTKCIEDLGPGAKSLLPKLKEFKIDDKAVRDLTVYDWAEIVKAFDAWPFAPKDLGINDGKLDDYGGRGGGPRY
ncbi:S-adenosyl-L-methionine-dependent methyltransferase [Rhodocollybia butyracea]|uniref:rRNA adenine N(6)-methyltransferase n=1 Tax=Rhodocollybia butyracea TaxID=206335 RepID=A0A9P5PSU5_9AGAR|nr:S-adenosyl-L-methionine-dependent methyltransferase [Rhodocollybia butyracea]